MRTGKIWLTVGAVCWAAVTTAIGVLLSPSLAVVMLVIAVPLGIVAAWKVFWPNWRVTLKPGGRRMLIVLGGLLVVGGIVLIAFQLKVNQTQHGRQIATPTMEQQMAQILAKLDEIKDQKQLVDAFKSIQSSIGMVEDGSGNPEMIVPLGQSATNFGVIYPGSRQTFVGLTVDDSPFLFRIPTPGTKGLAIYSLAAISVLNNDRYELLMVTQKNMPFPFSLSIGIEGQDNDLSLTTPLSKGFFRQISEAPIIGDNATVSFKNRAIAVQVEWNYEFR
jgi:hypothetical protein